MHRCTYISIYSMSMPMWSKTCWPLDGSRVALNTAELLSDLRQECAAAVFNQREWHTLCEPTGKQKRVWTVAEDNGYRSLRLFQIQWPFKHLVTKGAVFHDFKALILKCWNPMTFKHLSTLCEPCLMTSCTLVFEMGRDLPLRFQIDSWLLIWF